MEKKKIQAATAIIFASMLAVIAMTDSNRKQGEFGQIQDAMRRLRRVDNLKFSHSNTLLGGSGERTDQTDVWADNLTGNWVSEHYTVDEDGVRMVQRQFCDGRDVYQYIDWSGIWEEEWGKSTDIPNIEMITSFDHDIKDVQDIESVQENGVQKISYSLTSEYLTSYHKQNEAEMKGIHEDYVSRGASEDEVQAVELALAQYQQTQIEGVFIIYTIDADGILLGITSSSRMVRPEMVSDGAGQMRLGKELEIQMDVAIEVADYDSNDILYKIGQYTDEIKWMR